MEHAKRQLTRLLIGLIVLMLPGWAQTPAPEPEETPTPVVSPEPSRTPASEPDTTPTPEESASPEPTPSEAPVVEQTPALGPRSGPKQAVEGFLGVMADAGPLAPSLYLTARQYLDLSQTPTLVREEKSVTYANDLYAVLTTGDIDYDRIPLECQQASYVVYRQPSGDTVELTRNEEGEWLFSADTLRRVHQMREVLEKKGKLAAWEVPPWLDFTFLSLTGLQWFLLVVTPVLAWFVGRCSVLLLRRLVRNWLQGEAFGIEPDEQKKVLRPLGWLVGSLVFWVGLSALKLPELAFLVAAILIKLVATSSFVLSAYRLCDVLAAYLHFLTKKTDTTYDDMLVPLLRRTLKVLITVLGIIFIAQNLDLEVWSLFAGFSVVGAMVALAGQDLVKNFFGSLTVLMDRPFSVGDWVNIEGVEGVVEDVGFRSTRIRTFYDSVISLPNSRLITASVDNYGLRSYRRYSKKLNLHFHNDPQQVEAFCEGLRELVRRHPYTRKDSYQIWVNDVNEFALEILIYIFFRCPDWNTELRERHRFLVDTFRLGRSLGIEFAYPTSLVHLRQNEEKPSAGDGFSLERFQEASRRGRETTGELVERSLPATKPGPAIIE